MLRTCQQHALMRKLTRFPTSEVTHPYPPPSIHSHKYMRYISSRIVIFSTVLLFTVALSLACIKSSAPKETPPPNSVIVSPNGGGQYRTIGEALKGVQPGMRILVRAGVYNEGLIIDKQVEIVADPRGAGEQVVLLTLHSSSITMRTDRALVR